MNHGQRHRWGGSRLQCTGFFRADFCFTFAIDLEFVAEHPRTRHIIWPKCNVGVADHQFPEVFLRTPNSPHQLVHTWFYCALYLTSIGRRDLLWSVNTEGAFVTTLHRVVRFMLTDMLQAKYCGPHEMSVHCALPLAQLRSSWTNVLCCLAKHGT